jgi:hypothetical protein
MPLAFQSLSQGEVAFGFFNIETDMILLNQYFFFASDFCGDVSALASFDHGRLETHWKAYILKEGDVGNLMAAIHGIHFSGFIGETYRLFPFPKESWAFKQNPDGYKTREVIEDMIRRYASPSHIAIEVEATGVAIAIGGYVFDGKGFHELLKYVWVGGYPKWKDDLRPQYVLDMKKAIDESKHPLFRSGIDISSAR